MVVETSFRSDETFTQESFRAWLDRRPSSDLNHYELIRGRVVMSPPAGGGHGYLGGELSGILREHVKANRLGFMFDSSTGYELPSGDTLEPDVSFVSRERWEAGPKPIGDEFLRIVPSLVIEVLSPSTARRDRTEKLEIYAQNGVDEYWLVDPRGRSIEVLHRIGNVFAPSVAITSGRIPSSVLPGLEAHVEDIFAELD